MRRSGNNMNRQRGGYSGGSGGPLLTTHLHNLDMELKLLKRKRELIEQEQNIFNRFSNNSKRQNDYEQPFYTYNQQEPKQQQFNVGNFSNAYESSSSNNFNRPQGNKRPSNINWQNQNPPKRFNASQKISPWQTPETVQDLQLQSQNYKPQPSPKTFSPPPRPLMDIRPSISQRIKNRYIPPPVRKDFKPTKVTKNKPNLVKKPTNYPSVNTMKYSSNANSVITQTTTETSFSPKFTPKPKPKVQPSKSKTVCNVLRADIQPTLQMKGRMELALGMIIKEIKEQQCTDPAVLKFFMIPFIQRLIKHSLRTRIRNVMMNQIIDSVTDIVDKYRKKYPKETDIELMSIAKDAQLYSSNNCSVGQLVEADDPEDFFRKNITKIMVSKFEVIIGDLKKLYEGRTYNFDAYIEHFPEKSDNNTKTTDALDDKGKEKAETENITSSDKKNSDVIDITEEIALKIAKFKHYSEFMNKLIEQRLPNILLRFKDELISVMCIDKEFLGIKAMIVTETMQKQKLQSEVESNTITIDDEDDIPVQPVKSTKHIKSSLNMSPNKTATSKKTISTPSTTSMILQTSVPCGTSQAPVVPEKSIPLGNNKTTAPTKLLTISTNIATPDSCALPAATTTPKASTTLASSSIPAIIATESSSTTVSTAPPILTTTPVASKSPTSSATPVVLDMQATSIPATPAKSVDKSAQIPKTPGSKDISYVKLIGRPNLPSRAVIYDFLNTFNPASIKKHKSINNLLVIGFTDKEGYEKILAANESVVGDSTIIIKASEQVPNTPVQKKINEPENKTLIEQKMQLEVKTDIQNKDDKNLTEVTETSSEDILNSDLDSQISDLLSSIRKDNEKIQNEVSDKKIDTTEVLVEESLDTIATGEKIAVENDGDQKLSDQNDEKKSSDQSDNKISSELTEEKKSSVQNNEKVSAEQNDEKKTFDQMDSDIDSAIGNSTMKLLETVAEIDEEAKEYAVNDKVKSVEEVTKANFKESGRATPTRSSSRLANATPSTIKTRRASRLGNI